MFDFNSLFQSDHTDFESLLQDVQNGQAQLVDIREEVEWDQNHFADAINIPLSKLARGVGVDTLKQLKSDNKKILLHCQTGSRVRMAERMLAGFGCTDITIMATTMNAMYQNGFQLAH